MSWATGVRLLLLWRRTEVGGSALFDVATVMTADVYEGCID